MRFCMTNPADCKRNQEQVQEGNSDTAHHRLARMIGNTSGDDRQAYAHQNTTCDHEFTSAKFINHGQSTQRSNHHDRSFQGIQHELSMYIRNANSSNCKYVRIRLRFKTLRIDLPISGR